MDEAFAAGTFFLLKRTLVQTHESVFSELQAFSAKLILGSMMVSAVDFYHEFYGLFLSFHSFVFRIGRL